MTVPSTLTAHRRIWRRRSDPLYRPYAGKPASAWLLPALACCLLCGASGLARAQKVAEPKAAPHVDFDPRALQLLQQMAATYARLPGLDQKTEFYSASVPVKVQPPATVALAGDAAGPEGRPASTAGGAPPASGAGTAVAVAPVPAGGEAANADGSADDAGDPPGEKLRRSLRLLAVQPNLLRLELREYDPGSAQDRISEWVSDGKTFWTYTDEKHHYTKEATPPRLHDFQKLNHLDTGSLELLMLLGVNPFAEVRDEVESVHYLGQATVRGVATDVVTMRAIQSSAVTEARIYIGREDHLLHRLVTESTPLAELASPGKVGDALDALVDGRGPTPPPAASTTAPQFATSETDVPDPDPPVVRGPMKTVMAYDNVIAPLARTYIGDFRFVIPAGALLFEPLQLQNGAYKQKKQNLMDLFQIAGVKRKKRARVRVIKGG